MPGREPEPHHATTLNAAGCRVRLRSERPGPSRASSRVPVTGTAGWKIDGEVASRGDTMLVQTRRFAMTASFTCARTPLVVRIDDD